MATSEKSTPEAAPAKNEPPAENPAAQAELERQAAVVEAVDAANKNELPELGGDLMDPGLGK